MTDAPSDAPENADRASLLTAGTPSPGFDRIELMRTFLRIVDGGSLSTAAQLLGTTQPTVSRRLQTLEKQFGVRLLQRSTHGMRLTGDGERCYVHAKALVEEWDALEADLRGEREEARGLLRVLVPHAFGQDQLVAPLTAFLQQHPGVSVEWLLHDRRPDYIAEGIDCAIQVGAVDDPGVVASRLAEVPRIVVAAPSLLASRGAVPTAEELASLPWLSLMTFYRREVHLTRDRPTPEDGTAGEAPGAGNGLEAADRSQGAEGDALRFPIQPRLSTDSLYALRTAALSGLGAAIVSEWLVRDDLDTGRLLRLAPQWSAEPLPVWLVHPHARHYPARLRRFLEVMREVMPRLTGMRPVDGIGGRG